MFCGQEPASYNFGYMVNDYQEGTDFGHHEERQEESAHGEYHVVLPDGRKQVCVQSFVCICLCLAVFER